MPMLIRFEGGQARAAADPYQALDDADPLPVAGDVMVSLARLLTEGAALAARSGRLGVRLGPAEDVLALKPFAGRLDLIALELPKFRDGRAYSQARLARERLGFTGELRAVGEALVEQALILVRCGFDAVTPADGSAPEAWAAATRRYRHVYQRAADARDPASAERLRAPKVGQGA
ncbi:MAG: DUF934 domain-containing protein [Alphaproteobacteria bacterium]|nr:DUF934 domain-containing protein [Alphaproteobacteria bacterium]